MIESAKIAAMRIGGKKLAAIRDQVAAAVKPGVSLKTLDDLANSLMFASGGEPGFKKVPGYNWATCINLDDGIVHGIPHPHLKIHSGDLVKLDLGLYYQGYHTDTSTSRVAGNPTPEQAKFLDAGRKSLSVAIAMAKPGNRIGHISQAMQTPILAAGFTPTRQLTGHGVGRNLHEPPSIPCLLTTDIFATPKLTVGMTLAIETIYTAGSPDMIKLQDGWTLVTKDGSLAGLFEETVLITKSGPQILTTSVNM